MNYKQLVLLLFLVVVVGGLGLIVYKNRKSDWKESGGEIGRKLFSEFPINDVHQIVIKQAGAQVHLVRKQDRWEVAERDGYPANFGDISEFLRKVWDLKVLQPVKVGPGQLGRLELLEPGHDDKTGTLVEFLDEEGLPLRGLLLGKQHMKSAGAASPFGGGSWADGRYVMVHNEPATVSLVSEPFNNIEAKPEAWLDKDFFKVEKIRSISMQHPEPEKSWSISRESEGAEWKLADAREGEELDSSKVAGMNYLFSSPGFVDVASASTPAETTGMDKPAVARIGTFDGLTYTIKLGNKTAEDNFYLSLAVEADIPKAREAQPDEKPEDKEKLETEFKEKVKRIEEKLQHEKKFENRTFLVSKWTVEPVLKERKELLKEEKPAEKADAASAETPVAPKAAND